MILVTGASGFIGRHLVRALAADDQPVRAMVRSDRGASLVPEGAEVVRGDLADADSLKAVAAGCETVFHLAGAYRGPAPQMHQDHLVGTARLLRGLDPGSRFVYVSSTSVYGWNQHWPADDLAPPRPESAYGKAKLAAERLVLSRAAGPSVVARPTITYGEGDLGGMVARAHRLLTRGMRRFPGSGDNRIHLTHIDDLIAGLKLLGSKGEGVFLLAGPSATPVREIFSLLALGAGLRAPSFVVPAKLVRPLARGFDAAWSALGRDGEAPLSVHSLDVLTRDRSYTPVRAPAELGWSAQVTSEEGLPAVGAWLSKQADGPSKAVTASKAVSKAAVLSGNATSGSEAELGFDWRGYVEDNDEGLGTVYERFALRDVLQNALERTGSTSVLHAPLFGMMGFPGLDAVFMAQTGVRVGLLDFSEERMETVLKEWHALGLDPEVHMVDSADPKDWPEHLSADYDLVFSFAALWWFDDPWAVVEAQMRWADKGLLVCVPNKNVFIRVRALLWHQGLFDRLNEEALDRKALTGAARRLGLEPVDTGLFDIPPFPDTSVPLAKVVRALLGRSKAGDDEDAEATAWRWSILPFLRGEQPDLEGRIARLAAWERYLPDPVAPSLAHHRYTLFLPDHDAAAATATVKS